MKKSLPWVVIAVLAGFAGVKGLPKEEVVLGAQEEVRQINWEKIVQDYPTYRDGYVQLAISSLRSGDKESAKKWIQKTLEIDPNYELSPTLLTLLK